MSTSLTPADWIGLFTHFTALSLLAVGGVITTVPDMQRYLVHERGWIGDGEFTASVALAQAAPGPNVLFVAVLGWNVAGAAGAAHRRAVSHPDLINITNQRRTSRICLPPAAGDGAACACTSRCSKLSGSSAGA